MSRTRLSLAEARRVALAAQGFGRRPPGPVGMRQVQRVIDTVHVLQIDSVNVLSRSHYLPLFSRLGPYPRELLDRASGRAPRRLAECWAHEASFVAPGTYHLLRWRMARASEEAWGGMVAISRERPGLLDAVLALVAGRGPLTSAQLERALAPDQVRVREAWGWNWSDTKRAVEYLFWAGRLASAGRTQQFERRYQLPERVLPASIAGAPDLDPADAVRGLVELAARAHGVATAACLRDYFRLRAADAGPAIRDLVEAGTLVPTEVSGWDRPAYLHRDARVPRRLSAVALLSPFDSLVWFRDRVQAVFGFHYRIEIYTPPERRVHGYYVLPFLLGDRLVARVDLKADRAAGLLRARSAWAEPQAPRGTAAALAAELIVMAGWLGLDDVAVEPRGDLADGLAGEVAGLSGVPVHRGADLLASRGAQPGARPGGP